MNVIFKLNIFRNLRTTVISDQYFFGERQYSLGTKYHLKQTFFIFWTKFPSKGVENARMRNSVLIGSRNIDVFGQGCHHHTQPEFSGQKKMEGERGGEGYLNISGD